LSGGFNYVDIDRYRQISTDIDRAVETASTQTKPASTG
jgi:hypothetical protein